MRVGSLHKPWEYDGRLPPDAGYYLDLVIPRKEESRKKKHVHVRITTCKNVTNTVINLHAIQSRNTGESTSKTDQNPYRCIRGAMGGLTPLTEPLPGCIPPPRGGAWVCERQALLLTLRGKPKRATLRGCFRSNPPQMAPPNLGIARIRWEYSWSNRYRFSPIFSDFLGRIFLVIGRVSFTSTISLYDHCFFFRNRPLEDLINRVELFEEKSILVFPECLEASEW